MKIQRASEWNSKIIRYIGLEPSRLLEYGLKKWSNLEDRANLYKNWESVGDVSQLYYWVMNDSFGVTISILIIQDHERNIIIIYIEW